MSYRLGKSSYYSHVTKREYQFKPGDRIDQRRAKSQMEHEASVFQTAEQTRIANMPPDTRSPAERVRAETVHKSQQSGEPGVAMQSRLTDLQQRLARAQTPQDKARLQRRIDQLQPRSDQHQVKVDAKAAREALANSPEVVAAVADAQELYDSLKFKPDVAQEIVEGAEAALSELKQSLDVATFKATAASIKGKYHQARQATMAQLRANIAAIESDIATVKADAATPEATQLVAAE